MILFNVIDGQRQEEKIIHSHIDENQIAVSYARSLRDIEWLWLAMKALSGLDWLANNLYLTIAILPLFLLASVCPKFSLS